MSGRKAIKKVFLCASSENYFVLFEDGSSTWSASESFSNEILADKRMAPSDIEYLNSSIKSTFRDGTSIYATMNDLKHGCIDPDDIPAIKVVKYKGDTYSLDNRRLWAFKNAHVDEIPVIVKAADASFISRLNKKVDYSIRIR